jgi:hypothetical protein
MKYLITIILILTLFTGCAVKRYNIEKNSFRDYVEQHPVRPDICPPDTVKYSTHFMPGDAVFMVDWSDYQYEHQRCYDLYGGCAVYLVDKDVFSGPDIGCFDEFTDKETCLAKGGEWLNYIIVDWCWYPYIEE